jgi:hypothetical protein
MDQTFRPLLDALKQIGVDSDAVDRAAAEAQRSGRSVRAVLINDQVVTEEQLTQAAAAAFGINTLDRSVSRPTRRRSNGSRCRSCCGTGCSASRSTTANWSSV